MSQYASEEDRQSDEEWIYGLPPLYEPCHVKLSNTQELIAVLKPWPSADKIRNMDKSTTSAPDFMLWPINQIKGSVNGHQCVRYRKLTEPIEIAFTRYFPPMGMPYREPSLLSGRYNQIGRAHV